MTQAGSIFGRRCSAIRHIVSGPRGHLYQVLNLIGSATAYYALWLVGFAPFAVLGDL